MGHLCSPQKSYFVSKVWSPSSNSYKYKLNIIVDLTKKQSHTEKNTNDSQKLIDFKKKLLTFINL